MENKNSSFKKIELVNKTNKIIENINLTIDKTNKIIKKDGLDNIDIYKKECYDTYCKYKIEAGVTNIHISSFFNEAGILRYTQRLLGFCTYEKESVDNYLLLKSIIENYIINGIENNIKRITTNSTKLHDAKEYYNSINIKTNQSSYTKTKENFVKLKKLEIINHNKNIELSKLTGYFEKCKSHKTKIDKYYKYFKDKQNEIIKLKAINQNQNQELDTLKEDKTYKLCKTMYENIKNLELNNFQNNKPNTSLIEALNNIENLSLELKKIIEATKELKYIYYDEAEESNKNKYFQISEYTDCCPALVRNNEIIYIGKITINKI